MSGNEFPNPIPFCSHISILSFPSLPCHSKTHPIPISNFNPLSFPIPSNPLTCKSNIYCTCYESAHLYSPRPIRPNIFWYDSERKTTVLWWCLWNTKNNDQRGIKRDDFLMISLVNYWKLLINLTKLQLEKSAEILWEKSFATSQSYRVPFLFPWTQLEKSTLMGFPWD